jgi:hypothetical protein
VGQRGQFPFWKRKTLQIVHSRITMWQSAQTLCETAAEEKCPSVCGRLKIATRGGAVAQLGARLDGIEEVVGSNPIGSTN